MTVKEKQGIVWEKVREFRFFPNPPWELESVSIRLRNSMYNTVNMADPAKPEAVAAPTKQVRTLAEFLESAPPDFAEEVRDRGTARPGAAGSSWYLNRPDLQLYCENCDGYRTYFSLDGDLYLSEDVNYKFMRYGCRNCRSTATAKTFALVVQGRGSRGVVQKLGELPPFGPPTPPRVFQLIGEDYRKLFLQGRRAENKGLGIGAYGYYRRIVEHQKGRIIDEIRRVAEKLGESAEMVKTLSEARTETQFSSAIEKIKDAIPRSLLIDGHNPLTLLHNALSEGLHELTDEECLRLATSIRVVLIELADRISAALKEEAELKSAVSALLNRKVK